MKTMKYLVLALSLAAAPLSSHATGLVFNTSAFDILTSNSGAVADGTSLTYGTLSSTDGTTFADFQANFTQLGSAVFDAGEVTIISLAGTLPASATLFGLATTGTDSIVFEFGTTPALGFLNTNPSLVTNVLLGSGGSGASLVMNAVAVPEPSAFAAIAGVLALGFVAVRRRRA